MATNSMLLSLKTRVFCSTQNTMQLEVWGVVICIFPEKMLKETGYKQRIEVRKSIQRLWNIVLFMTKKIRLYSSQVVGTSDREESLLTLLNVKNMSIQPTD